ncbi:GbsR/MarR family transcriptional regulator [Sporolactobacillus kofuensis]|uniref:HTH-type transcriptional regulator n=1 Tax=Sporolactobacillus kofuensis TaxID=269672 RepID=A0ABW1WFH9_9BACL|nr:GbsR/MarR family transcriptional regulator [Sporolactobacillus kofuensis]MCO7175187.1 GbsR/MarR family transcriptional regulator [Sporolactobacillus kofuensis]
MIENTRERVIEAISQNMFLYGVTPSIGRLYGTLYFKDQPMTLDDMKEELKMSKTSMSTSVRTLSELNMVERVWRKGVRRDLYEAKKDWYQIFTDYFSNQWRKVTAINVKAVKQSLKELNKLKENEDLTEEEAQVIQADIDKYHYVLDYYDWLSQFLDLLESDEIFKIVEKKQQGDN